MKAKIGVLLVNLGTPNSPHPKDVKKYLKEFLTDGRVIDIPWIWRQLIVRGWIIPRRYKQSAAAYQKIWTEGGSPLALYGNQVKELLQKGLGENFLVELAMRYGNPTIERGIGNLLQHDLSSLLILPLFPQYASATSGSVHQRTMEVLKQFQVIPRVTFMQNFFDHHLFIDAFADIAQSYPLDQYDHILFSYHGLPEGQIKKRDRHQHCLRSLQCCEQMSLINRDCYAAQCFATTQALVSKLNLSSSQYSLCFQSRLGKQPWLQPYASDRIKTLAAQGSKRLLVFCPSFVCDCLETIYEFGVEYAAEFKHAGGERLDLVPGLNAHPKWIEALKAIVLSPLPC